MGRPDVELAVEGTDDLFAELRRLAKQRFGHASDEAVGQIVSDALDRWAESTRSGEAEDEVVEEPVAAWDQDDERSRVDTEEGTRAWLFRRSRQSGI